MKKLKNDDISEIRKANFKTLKSITRKKFKQELLAGLKGIIGDALKEEAKNALKADFKNLTGISIGFGKKKEYDPLKPLMDEMCEQAGHYYYYLRYIMDETDLYILVNNQGILTKEGYVIFYHPPEKDGVFNKKLFEKKLKT